MQLNDGSFYEGVWINGQMSGLGKMSFKDGSYYEGLWDNNLMHGSGVC